ncbi:hypothetical protein [Nonomuraea sp. JJY05]|uniref:hypothetical protein n=1 Tax=Nonomuraea sp. JJY05 TaxID=3350255 RepID=UPI00373F3C48
MRSARSAAKSASQSSGVRCSASHPRAQAIAPISPGYWATTMLQAAVRGDVAGTTRPAAVVARLGLAAGAFAWWRFGKGWGRGSLL